MPVWAGPEGCAGLFFPFSSRKARRLRRHGDKQKRKGRVGWGGFVVVAVPKWSRSVQDSSPLPGIHLPFQPAPPILTKTFFFFSLFAIMPCHLDSCRPGHLRRARPTDTERASDAIDGKANSAIPAVGGVTAGACARQKRSERLRRGMREPRRGRRLVKTAAVVSVILEERARRKDNKPLPPRKSGRYLSGPG